MIWLNICLSGKITKKRITPVLDYRQIRDGVPQNRGCGSEEGDDAPRTGGRVLVRWPLAGGASDDGGAGIDAVSESLSNRATSAPPPQSHPFGSRARRGATPRRTTLRLYAPAAGKGRGGVRGARRRTTSLRSAGRPACEVPVLPAAWRRRRRPPGGERGCIVRRTLCPNVAENKRHFRGQTNPCFR